MPEIALSSINSDINLGDLGNAIITTDDYNNNIIVNNYGQNEELITIIFKMKDNDLNQYGSDKQNTNNFILNLNSTTQQDDKTISDTFKANVLIVAAGGGGGYNIGGGGGGGEVIYIDNIDMVSGIPYNILVGKGGKGSSTSTYTGDSGYNSAINNIVALGGGGGGSYIYDKIDNFYIDDIKDQPIIYTYTKHQQTKLKEGSGLDGGSGGGSCCLQFYNDIEEENIYKGNNNKVLNSVLSDYDYYYSYGNNGGITINNIEKFNNKDDSGVSTHISVTGAGGGGAGKAGDNGTIDIHRPHGGDGICIEDILTNTGNIKFCSPIFNGISCDIRETTHFFTNEPESKYRSEINGETNHYYYGAGGGGGSFNRFAGNGGKGGGGGGGYCEIKLSVQQDTSICGTNSYNSDSTDNCDGKNGNKDNVISTTGEFNNLNSKGGNGLNHTGSGGGGGGFASNGGHGGSGLVVILLRNVKEPIEQEIEETTMDKAVKISNIFNNEKAILGKNLATLYEYNIKEHKEFYDYIERLYDKILIKKNKLIQYNYEREAYDVYFHQYLKIVFDMKINYESFLFFSKIKNEEKYTDNLLLKNYERLVLILVDLIEDIIIFCRDKKDYYEIINNVDRISISYKDIDRKKEYKNEDDNYYNFEEIFVENTKYTYLHLYISNSNNYEMYNENTETYENILDQNVLDSYNINNIDIGNILNENKNLEELLDTIKSDVSVNINDISIFIKIYLYILLKVKKSNFIKNILSIYIYFCIFNILKKIYRESERIFLYPYIKDDGYDKLNQDCENIYDNILFKFDKNVIRMKSLIGYNFIDEYIENYKINNLTVKEIYKPKIDLELNEYDTQKLLLTIQISLFYEEDEGENKLVLDTFNFNSENKNYYNKITQSFAIEIDDNRYNITNYKYDNNKIIISIDDKYNKLSKVKNSIIKDVLLVPKDYTHINEIYETDKNIITKYDLGIREQQKELENIDKKFNTYNVTIDKIETKKSILYLIIVIVSIYVISINLLKTNDKIKSISYVLLLILFIIILIYNYSTNLSYSRKIEGFSDYTNKNFTDFIKYYRIKINSENVRSVSDSGIVNITITLNDIDKEKLKIRKYKNGESKTETDIGNLIKSNFLLYYDKDIIEIQGITIDDSDIYYYRITELSFTYSQDIQFNEGEDKFIYILRNEKSIIKKLLSTDNYITYNTNTLSNKCSDTGTNALLKDITNSLEQTEIDKIKMERLSMMTQIRNDVMSYINNKFIHIYNIIDTIELEKSLLIGNNIEKNMDNEKNKLSKNTNEYINKINKNKNVNNLYKHNIYYESNFMNFITIFSIILLLSLLIFNIFPSKIILIMIIATILIVINLFMFILRTRIYRRNNASQKYW